MWRGATSRVDGVVQPRTEPKFMIPTDLSLYPAVGSPGGPVLVTACVLIALATGAGLVVRGMRKRGLNRWLGSYLRQAMRRKRYARRGDKPSTVHLLLCIGDHFEPRNGGVGAER